jgi:hypothetical protein
LFLWFSDIWLISRIVSMLDFGESVIVVRSSSKDLRTVC